MFIDETWAKTNMARTHGRCRRGERLRMGYPHGHRKTTTFVAGLTLRGMIAPFVLSGPINRDAFEAYVGQVLVPELRPGVRRGAAGSRPEHRGRRPSLPPRFLTRGAVSRAPGGVGWGEKVGA